MYVHTGTLKNMGGKGSGLTAQVVGVNASSSWIRLAAGPCKMFGRQSTVMEVTECTLRPHAVHTQTPPDDLHFYILCSRPPRAVKDV
jgi:hypothetical protein